jgi:hypothetical protein
MKGKNMREFLFILFLVSVIVLFIITLIFAYKSENVIEGSFWGYIKNAQTDKMISAKDLQNKYKSISIWCGAIALILIFTSFLCFIPNKVDTQRKITTENLIAFTDSSEQEIYGYIKGNIFYINGEVESTSNSYIKVLSTNPDGSIKIYDFNLSDGNVHIFLVDTPSGYMTTEVISQQKYCMFFNKKANTGSYTEETHYNIYLPINSLSYDNTLNGK